MTLAEMTPEKWAMLGYLAVGIGLMWCAGLFIRSLWKNDDDKRPEEGPKDW